MLRRARGIARDCGVSSPGFGCAPTPLAAALLAAAAPPQAGPRDTAQPTPALPTDPAQRDRALLLRQFETSPLSKANFCALKGLKEPELDAALAQARGAQALALRQAVERKRLDAAARRAYSTDLATGLPNHGQLMEHMNHLLALREREPAVMALLGWVAVAGSLAWARFTTADVTA